ncbi:MAG: dephospho-CoA kinase [Bacteroidetes bacterium]|jgi:dephospho-CoA kinase|nr:dephospho-CoA kinase [Bacteroidota bacterium]MBT5528719.1 dephospho-CoA kinase [Cytophagia bacterium]MBT3422481.1 dephospho-CoA kinase [Bacteroidota bacterium]MBT3935717.1 dephospho-CoA kinase [Bacteroidota bacterium]MBT4340422.1 dephospho-CoA kinase [Bacteroidota bacterium]
MIKVGVTGGIGSGKTTVCSIFEHLGVPVYYSDEKSKELIQSNSGLIKQIKAAFGNHLYDDQNNLNKAALASLVFSNEKALATLNSIVHPAVVDDFNAWCSQHQQHAYVIKESALLFESNTYKNLDFIIAVFAPLEMRLKRLMERDQTNEEELLKRVHNQLADVEKMKRSDFVIFNDMKHPLIRQILSLHKELSKSLI